MKSIPRWAWILAALIAAVIVVWLIVDNNDEPANPVKPTRPQTVTVTLGGQGKKEIVLPPAAQAITAQQRKEDQNGDDVNAESDLNAPQPPAGVVQETEQLKPPGQPDIPRVIPQAAPSAPGCPSAFVRNQSSRNGAPVLLGMIHWTGSRNLPGTADVLGIVRWFDTPAAQSSSNYITDDEGNCRYVVPETAKAWTQAGANPWSVSIEVINPGVLPLFGAAAGRAKVVQLMRGWHDRWKLPYRRGAVNSSCVPTRSGFLAHRDLGACGGGHPDVGPSPATLDGLIASAAATTPTIPAGVTSRCKKIAAFRRAGKASNQWQTARVEYVRKRGYRCGTKGNAIRR